MADKAEPNAGSRSQVEKKEKKARLRELKRHEELRTVVSQYEGRAVLWSILELCGIYQASYRGDQFTEFREGKRSVGLSLLGLLSELDEELYVKMQQEAARREKDGL